MSFLKKEDHVEDGQKQAKISLYEASEKLKVDEAVFDRRVSISKSMLSEERKLMEAEFKSKEATMEIENRVARKSKEEIELDARIEYKKKLLDSLSDGKDMQMQVMKDANDKIIKSKDEMIEMLKGQVEILTAKLTEIKISDAHIHVQAAVQPTK